MDASQLAQFWSVYFAMRAVKNPPAFLIEAESELRAFLYADPPPDSPSHLRLVPDPPPEN